MDNFIITIGRGFGSGGKEIGTLLSKELNIPCYDNQFYNMLEEYSGISKKLFVNADENLKGPHLLKKLKKFPAEKYVVSPMEKEFISNDNLYRIQSRLIRELTKNTSCIILGKCANHVLKEYDNVLSVYVDAPKDSCIKSVCSKLGTTEDEAYSLILKTNKYRSDYYRYYTNGEKWSDPLGYDLIINTGRISKTEAVELILHRLKTKNLV